MKLIITYIMALAIFLFIDFFWLRYAAKTMYDNQIGFLLKEKFNLTAAFIFYIFFIIGLVFFVISPAGSWQFAFLAGLFFGALTYGTYDMTNLATLKDWPLKLTIIDIIWGSFICGITSVLTYLLINLIY